jgi:hypothetical protein
MSEVVELMTKVFDNNSTGTDALAWSVYWRELNIYEESLRDGKGDYKALEVYLILFKS